MKFTQALVPLAALVATAQAGNNTYYTTIITTDYTTYCPAPTTVTYGNVTYTATSETTLTITNCPCTVTYPTSVLPPITIPSTEYPTTVLPPVTITYSTGTVYPTGNDTAVPPPTGVPTEYPTGYPSEYPPTSYSLTTITSGETTFTSSVVVPTKTPIAPTSSAYITSIPTAAAARAAGPAGALLAAGMAFLAL